MRTGNVAKVACKWLIWAEETYSLTKILEKVITKKLMEEHGDITDSDYNLQKEFVKILK